MPERELFVVCKECGNEVSPYVTECPYCGNRLRKRAPDIESVRKREQKAQRRAAARSKRAERSRRRAGRRETPAYLQTSTLPVGITIYIVAAVVVSLVARADYSLALKLVATDDVLSEPWRLLSAPLVHFGFGFGFVSLMGCAIFGTGIERRFGAVETLAVAIVCGAAGVAAELLFGSQLTVSGANGVALGLMACWLIVVATREDIRDVDTYGVIAVGALLVAMPLATGEASIWAATGGLTAGVLSGFALSRVRRD